MNRTVQKIFTTLPPPPPPPPVTRYGALRFVWMTEFKCPGADTYVQAFLQSSACCAVTRWEHHSWSSEGPASVSLSFSPASGAGVPAGNRSWSVTVASGEFGWHTSIVGRAIESAGAISLAAYFSLPSWWRHPRLFHLDPWLFLVSFRVSICQVS